MDPPARRVSVHACTVAQAPGLTASSGAHGTTSLLPFWAIPESLPDEAPRTSRARRHKLVPPSCEKRETPSVVGPYRPLREVQAIRGLYIVPSGKVSVDEAVHVVSRGKRNPLASSPELAYRPAQEAALRHTAPSGAVSPTAKTRVCSAYRPFREGITFSPGNTRVRPYRHAQELIPSSPGRLVVPPRNQHRLRRESISSVPGRYTVMPGKTCRLPQEMHDDFPCKCEHPPRC